ncbi:hypothetical protein ISF_02749 [Cordyceps fumosorosea ARSEF 2679]|uniref:Uncharacterized protein n=1 Tax=Cordyceps fumosorosea (strain ARSEF 2679) TaxID=1081104 RepID=A0A162MSB5_CORFA|nr:hypothetical protein ISF_02749 [Cordyceps fumosorosea ARSEF 2679]OAA69479.1 hypothetical protein ISF_02749 [Cordyceps fumosorosea ARSEF 2679]
MTMPGNKDEKQAMPSSPQDLATAYREITKGEQTATQLEANLTNLESKLDAMLAAFEQQQGSPAPPAQGGRTDGGKPASSESTNSGGKGTQS